MSKHWNIANSIIQGRFIRQVPLMGRLAILVGLGVITALLTWKLHALPGSISVLLMILSYTGVAVFAFVHYRYWLPLALPTVGSLLMMHLVLVIHRVRIEQTERNRIRSIFSRMVSPNIVQELLQKKKLAVDGARRELTVFFADIRQFTQVTDLDQSRSIEQARRQGLEGEEAEHWLDEQAREILDTVNLYLATIADMVKKYNGTLDKYIGDCVMAFWGAPAANPNHARDCVRAAMDAQRAVALLNRGREAENRRREEVNRKRGLSGEQPLSMLPVLQIGTGINTGVVTVGLMGSEEHNFNYTVFGREVNLASRLETASGHGRIYIGEATYQQLLRTDSELASSCVKLPPLSVKGFHEEVSVFEVPWQGRELHAPASTETTSRPASGQPADATPSGDPAAV